MFSATLSVTNFLKLAKQWSEKALAEQIKQVTDEEKKRQKTNYCKTNSFSAYGSVVEGMIVNNNKVEVFGSKKGQSLIASNSNWHFQIAKSSQ